MQFVLSENQPAEFHTYVCSFRHMLSLSSISANPALNNPENPIVIGGQLLDVTTIADFAQVWQSKQLHGVWAVAVVGQQGSR